jgi:hypothetical protein
MMTEPILPPWEKSGAANMVRTVKVDKVETYNLQTLYSQRARQEADIEQLTKELASTNDLIKQAEELGLKLEESRYEPEEKPEEPIEELKP